MNRVKLGDFQFKEYLPAAKIASRVASLGAQINKDYTSDEPPIVIALLNGAFIFAADLCRQFDSDCLCLQSTTRPPPAPASPCGRALPRGCQFSTFYRPFFADFCPFLTIKCWTALRARAPDSQGGHRSRLYVISPAIPPFGCSLCFMGTL